MIVHPKDRSALPSALPAETFQGKPKQTEREALRWVLDNLALSSVDTDDCPSAKAWLFFYRASTDAYFADKLMIGFTPSRTQLDKDQELNEDGSDVRERLVRIAKRSQHYLDRLEAGNGPSGGHAEDAGPTAEAEAECVAG